MENIQNKRLVTKSNDPPMTQLIRSMNDHQKNGDYIVDIDENYKLKKQNLIGKANIFQGPVHSGKKTCAKYLARQHNLELVVIDCMIYQTQTQFFEQLAKEAGSRMDVSLNSKIIVADTVDMSQLNDILTMAKKKFLFLVRHSQKLVDYKKQLLLYNMLEWVKTDASSYVGIIFSTTLLNITQKFQKRVKSRFNGKAYWFMYPDEADVLKVILARIQTCYDAKDSGIISKIFEGIKDNKGLEHALKEEQSVPKNYLYYLNVFKIMFSKIASSKLLDGHPKHLPEQIAILYRKCTAYLNPHLNIGENLLENLDYPDYFVMSVGRHMVISKILPITLNTIYQVYQKFMTKYVSSESGGSSMNYPKRVLQRSIKKLYDLKLINLEKVHENIENKDITIRVDLDGIQNAIKAIPHSPQILKKIIND